MTAFVRPSQMVFVGLLLFVSLLPSAASAQDSRSVNELRQAVSMNMSKGAFAESIPDIKQLITYLGESKDPKIKLLMQGIFFDLGIAHFFLGEFEPSEKAFREYKKRYPTGANLNMAELFIADCLRFKGKLKDSLSQYDTCLKKYSYELATKVDIYCAQARCLLADGRWHEATEPLQLVVENATDFVQYNWAATLLVTAYFKDMELDKIYPLVPMLLRPNSFASRSIAFNMAAMEAGDVLFGNEQYRDALWVFRMVYPHDLVSVRSEQYLADLQKRAERLRSGGGDARALMRLQESIGELEEEVKALEQIENYDIELTFRLARGYMELARFYEGREMFMYLHENCEKEQAEEALYSAFMCSTGLLPWDRAYEIGKMYMEKYASGEWFDQITLMMGQMYAKQQNWPEVIAHMTKTLEMHPQHQSAAECLFLLGYACFMEEQFKKAADTLKQMRDIYPENDLVGQATYWIAMAELFDGLYAEAGPEFDKVLKDYSNTIFVEDATFRRAVCDYGLSMFEDSEKRFSDFVEKFPQSKMLGEATMMRGDIAGAVGRLKDAVSFYQQAMGMENLNIEQYNHCAFQAGRILSEAEDYKALRAHFMSYIEKNREGSNLPQGIYYVGLALWNTGEQKGAMNWYRDAVERFGKDPKAVGIDIILEEWIAKLKRLPADEQKNAWNTMKKAYRDALDRNDKTTQLRLTRTLLFQPDLGNAEKQNMINSLLKEENYPFASAGVLQAILDYAIERKQRDFAVRTANEIIQRFTETDYALDARMTLANFAIEKAGEAKETIEADELYDEALKHLGVVKAIYANTPQAAQALTTMGSLLMQQKKYAEADECFKSVLGVKEWKHLWPEALFGRGECNFAQRKFQEATAYYERIYLMYSHYKNWAAKSYLRRAECLKRLFQQEKAAEVLKEMLANPDLADREETKEARAMLQNL